MKKAYVYDLGTEGSPHTNEDDDSENDWWAQSHSVKVWFLPPSIEWTETLHQFNIVL